MKIGKPVWLMTWAFLAILSGATASVRPTDVRFECIPGGIPFVSHEGENPSTLAAGGSHLLVL